MSVPEQERPSLSAEQALAALPAAIYRLEATADRLQHTVERLTAKEWPVSIGLFMFFAAVAVQGGIAFVLWRALGVIERLTTVLQQGVIG